MLTYIILGISQGAVLGLLALGIVLVYKGTGVLNFAQGEFGTLAAYFGFVLITERGMPYLVGIFIAIALSALLGFLVDLVIVRRLFDAPRVTLLVATAGFSLLALSLELIIWRPDPKFLANLKEGNLPFSILGATVSWQRLFMLIILGGLSVGLAYFFNKTDTGLAILATSQEPVATELVGIGTRKISSLIWVLAAVLGGIAGLLQGPDTRITPFFMSGYLLLAFTAAVVGGITSLSGALVGGQVIGVFSQLAVYFNVNYIKENIIDIPAFEQLLVFILLVTVLVVRPRGLLGTAA